MKDTEGMNRLVYVSGSITGATADEMKLFDTAGEELKERGFRVYVPREMPGAVKEEDRWVSALSRDIRVITHCHGIAVLGTWERSKGAALEIFTALSLRKALVLLKGQHPDWHESIRSHIRDAQAELWKNVDPAKFMHHTDLPLVGQNSQS